MPCKCNTIISHMEELAPAKLTQSWDNTGLMLGDAEQEVHTVLVALDVTGDVIDEAIKNKANMIITHHPLIFKPLYNIRKGTTIGDKVHKLIQNNISVFSAHTNLDMADGGVNDVLALQLGLSDIKTLKPIETGSEEVAYDVYSVDNVTKEYGFAKVGKLEKEMSINEFSEKVKLALGTSFVKVVGKPGKKIRTVAVSSGAYSGIAQIARAKKVDAIVTGDLKYHDAQEILEYDMCAIDAGHFATENIIVSVIAEHVSKFDGNINVIKSIKSKDVFDIM